MKTNARTTIMLLFNVASSGCAWSKRLQPQFLLLPLQERLEVLVEFPENPDGAGACLGNPGATAPLAACGELDEGCRCLAVHRVDQVPGMPVGHLHGLRRLGDGPVLDDAFEQHHAAIADEGSFGPVDPYPAAKARPGPCGLLCTML